MNFELIRENRVATLDRGFEQSGPVADAHRPRRVAWNDQIDPRSAGAKRPDHQAMAVAMRAEDRMGIVMLQRQQALQLRVRRARSDEFSLHFQVQSLNDRFLAGDPRARTEARP